MNERTDHAWPEDMELSFVPRMRPDLPALNVKRKNQEWIFQCISHGGSVEVETYHATLPDALHQVVQRMLADHYSNYLIALTRE